MSHCLKYVTINSENVSQHFYLLDALVIRFVTRFLNMAFYWQLLTESSLRAHVWLRSSSCLLSHGKLWMWQWRMDAGHENGWNKGYTMLIFFFSYPSLLRNVCLRQQNLISTYDPKEGDILLHLKLIACKTTNFAYIYNTTGIYLRKSCCPFLF